MTEQITPENVLQKLRLHLKEQAPEVCLIAAQEIERLRAALAISNAQSSQILSTWEKVLATIPNADIAEKLVSTEARVRVLERAKDSLENSRPLCPDCRDKCRDEECLRCQIQRLKAEVERLQKQQAEWVQVYHGVWRKA